MARARGARAQFLGAFETTYGTQATANFFQLPFARQSLSQTQNLLENDLLGFGRDPIDPTGDAINADGDVSVPIDVDAWGFWLKGAFGAPVTVEDTGVYTHVFESGSWALPSMTFEVGYPDVPTFEPFVGCKIDRLSFNMQRSGLLSATVGLMAQGQNAATATTAGGSPNSLNSARYGQFNGSVERNGVPLGDVISSEVTYRNGLDRVETIRSDGKVDGLDESMGMMSGRTTVRFGDTALSAQALNGEACSLSFGFVRSADESFEISMPRVFLPQPRKSIEGPRGIDLTFDWQAAQDTNGDPMVTATLINAVDGY